MTTYFLTDRKQPTTVRVDDLAMMAKKPISENHSVMALYGGVVTPLALVHQQLRQTHQIPPQMQLYPVGRSNSSSSRDRCSPMHDQRSIINFCFSYFNDNYYIYK